MVNTSPEPSKMTVFPVKKRGEPEDVTRGDPGGFNKKEHNILWRNDELPFSLMRERKGRANKYVNESIFGKKQNKPKTTAPDSASIPEVTLLCLNITENQ